MQEKEVYLALSMYILHLYSLTQEANSVIMLHNADVKPFYLGKKEAMHRLFCYVRRRGGSCVARVVEMASIANGQEGLLVLSGQEV